MEQGKLDEALTAYQEMMDQKPGPQAYSRAANLRWLKGDVIGAIELMEMTVASSGNNQTASGPWALTKLADYEFQRGNFEHAIKYLDLVLNGRPDYAPALLLKGRIKMAVGELQKAVETLSRAHQLNPLPGYSWALIEALAATEGTADHRIRKVKPTAD